MTTTTKTKTKPKTKAKPENLIAAAAPQPDAMRLALLDKLNEALTAYEKNRSPILQKAMDDGGVDLVAAIETEYRALTDAYFEVLRTGLAANGAGYEQLMQQASTVTAEIKAKINSLQNAIDIINNIADAVNLVGRILILFGI